MRMMRVRPGAELEALMTLEPVTIGPGETLRDAVELLSAMGVSALPVVDGDRVLGLLSAQAIIAFEAGTPGVPTDRELTAWEQFDAPADDAPVVEYFAELWDDAGLDTVERFRAAETLEWDMLSEHTVDEAMTYAPPQLPSAASVRDVALLMRGTGSHGVLVVDDGKLRGIITTMDIARLVSRGRETLS